MLYLLASTHTGGDGIEVVPIIAIVFTFLWLIVKALMAPFTARAGKAPLVGAPGGLTEEEHAILEKLQRTISQMEDRVEALETILIEQRRSQEKYEPKA